MGGSCFSFLAHRRRCQRRRTSTPPATLRGIGLAGLLALTGAAGCASAVQSPSTEPTQTASPSQAPTASIAVSPSSLLAVGCGPAAAVTMPTDSDPTLLAFGQPAEGPLEGLVVTPRDPRVEALLEALVPAQPPAGSTLQRSLLLPWTATGATDETKLLLVYAPSSTDGLSAEEIIGAGGWFLAEEPARGHDALSIQRTLDSYGPGASRGYAMVQVGPYQGILIHESAPTPLGRPYGLHWSDGARDLSLRAAAPSNQVIDFARSLYCH